MSKEKKEPVDVKHAWTPEYKKVLEEINESGECPAPFCKDKGNGHKHSIEYRTNWWKVTRNTFNYQNALHAFLIIPVNHIENFSELTTEEWKDLRNVIRYLIKRYDLKGYSLVWRMGEKSHTGASVSHLHAHLICGNQRPDKNPQDMNESEMIRALVAFT